MRLVEIQHIKKNNINYKKIDELCFLSKNLYNYANYIIRKELKENNNYLNYNQIEKILRTENNFVYIPHSRMIDILKYKLTLEGIELIVREESYTSKCSFIDDESIEKHDVYKGKRIKRGLFQTSKGKLINADVNGSLNILRKEFPNVFTKKATFGSKICDRGLRYSPMKINL